MSPLLRAADADERLNVNVNTVYSRIRDQGLPCVRVGGNGAVDRFGLIHPPPRQHKVLGEMEANVF